MNRLHHLAATALIALSGTATAEPASPSHWLASWQASPQPVWGPDFLFPTLLPAQLDNQTFRQTARLSLGGPRLRVRLSNAHGTQPMQIDAASVAVEAGSPPLALRFDGQPDVRIAPGEQRLSDPLDLPTRNLQQVQISTYLAGPTPLQTFHWDGRQTS